MHTMLNIHIIQPFWGGTHRPK